MARVSIPDSCFKIVVVLDYGQSLDDVTVNTPVYAVKMPNINGIRSENWTTYKCSIDDIEASTGYDFLKNIDHDIEDIIESKK